MMLYIRLQLHDQFSELIDCHLKVLTSVLELHDLIDLLSNRHLLLFYRDFSDVENLVD